MVEGSLVRDTLRGVLEEQPHRDVCSASFSADPAMSSDEDCPRGGVLFCPRELSVGGVEDFSFGPIPEYVSSVP